VIAFVFVDRLLRLALWIGCWEEKGRKQGNADLRQDFDGKDDHVGCGAK